MFFIFVFSFLVVFVFDVGLSPLRGPFLILSVPSRSQLIQFELIKPTGVRDIPGGRYEFKIFSVCSQAVR